MKKASLLVPLVTAILLALWSAPVWAASLSTVDGDPNISVFAAARDQNPWTSEPLSALLVTFGSASSPSAAKAVQDAAASGTMVLAFGAEEEKLLNVIPGAGGSSRRVTASDEIPVAYYALQPEGYYSRGLILLKKPLTAQSVMQATLDVQATVLADRKAHDEVLARRSSTTIDQPTAPSDAVTTLGHGDLITVTIAHPPFYGDGYAQAAPYGKVGRGLMVEMKWNDGSNTWDYWFFSGLDQVIPGIYAFGSDWRSDEYRVKWVTNYTYEDVLQSAPSTTEPGRTWSVSYGIPFSFTLGGSIQEMRISNLSQPYGTPNYTYWSYDFTASNATIAKTPYPFDFSWSQANSQNMPFDSTSYQTYNLVTSGGATQTMRFQDWSLNVHKPGY